jgi:hypothetical protein
MLLGVSIKSTYLYHYRVKDPDSKSLLLSGTSDTVSNLFDSSNKMKK